MDSTFNSELNDLRRERELLTNELLDAKNNFANEIRDTLGEQIKQELSHREAPIVPPHIKKENWLKRFLDKLTKVFA